MVLQHIKHAEPYSSFEKGELKLNSDIILTLQTGNHRNLITPLNSVLHSYTVVSEHISEEENDTAAIKIIQI